MRCSRTARSVLPFFLVLGLARPAAAQNFPFTSGPIPLCDTSVFTANVVGVGILSAPGWSPWQPTWWLNSLTMNITSDHPQTLQVILTSPDGTDLLLTEYNGAGGQNYTNTVFNYSGYPSITTGTAPFTGNFTAQGGSFSAFDGENGSGTWTITVIDTACTNTGGGGGGGGGNAWTPGWFDGGGGGSGGFAMGFDPGPPPCWGWIPDGSVSICPGETVDIMAYYSMYGYWITVTGPNWTMVPDPTSVSAPGTYWIDATDGWTGCWYSAQFTVSLSTPSWLGADQNVDMCVGGSPVDLTALFTYVGAAPQWTFNGTPITAAQAAAASAPGIYEVTEQDPGGCSDVASVTLNIAAAPALGPDQSASICPGASLDLTALYNTTGLVANWSFGGSPFATPASAVVAGVYTLDVTSAGGCADQAQVTLTEQAALSLGADQSVDLCSGASADLTSLYSTTGLTTAWTLSGAPVADPTAVNAAGTYQLQASNSSGCSDIALVTVILAATPALGPDQSASICPGSSIDLTTLYTTTGLVAQWSFGGSPFATPANTLVAGVYTLQVTSGSGCTDLADVTLSVQPSLSLGADQSVDVCSGASVDLTALYTTVGLATAWTLTGVPVADPTAVSAAGTYQLEASGGSGCSDIALVTVNAVASPVLGADQSASICPGSGIDLTALYNTTGLTASWSFGGGPFATPASATAAGVYTLMVTSGAGCTDQADVTITLQPSLSLGADQSVDVCSGASVDLTTLYTTTGLTTEWTVTGAPVADPTTVTAPGTYQLVASNGSGCQDDALVTVNVLPNPALGADASAVLCEGQTADLTTIFNTTGLGTTWTVSGSPVADATTVGIPGTYALVATSAAGCTDAANVEVTVTANPALGADQVVNSCSNTFLDLTNIYTTTGLTAAWSFAGSPIPAPIAATAAGVYTLTVTSTAGCTDMADVTLEVDAAPSLGTDQIHDLCSNTTLDLTSLYNTTGLIATWYLWGAPVADPGHAAAGGTYELVASNGSGCGDTAYVSVNALTSPLLGADASATACEGEAVDLTTIFNTTGLGSAWTLAGASVPDPTSVNASGTYALIATNADGCSDTAQAVVTIAANPGLGADQWLTECDGTEVDLTTLYATGADEPAWTLNGVPVAEPTSVTSAGTYTLTVTNPAGCTAMAVVSLAIEALPSLGADQSSSICASSTFDLVPVYSTAGLSTAWTRNGATVTDPSAVDVTGDYQLVVTNNAGCTDTAVVALLVNPNPSLGGDLFFSLCPWQTVDLGALFPVAGMSASYTYDGQPLADPTAVADSGTYVVSVTDANGCTDEAIATVVDIECLCVADFSSDVRCMQEPARFTLLADSVIVGAQWEFSGLATGSTEIDPLMRFTSEGDVLVTLHATLSCGVVEVERTIHVDDCSDSCTVWIPSAFTPDGNGRNETWSWQGACKPEDFSMLIYSRWGELVYSSNDPQASWDGTYGGALCSPGVYAYRVGYRLPYQKRKEVKGAITLVR